MAKGLTVLQLMQECMKQIQAGNGSKEVYISSDEEGNHFNPCYYGFTTNSNGDIDSYKRMYCIDCEDANKVVLLG